MKKTPRHVKKAFMVASFIGAVLKSNQTGRPILLGLERKAKQGMYRFSVYAEPELYKELTDAGIKMWIDLSEEHSTKLLPDEVEIFVEMMGYIISPKDYKDFLGFDHFKSNVKTTDAKYAKVCHSVLALADEIHALLGTRNYTEPVRAPKVVKEKTKRQKSKKVVKTEPKKKSAKFLKNLEERKRKMKVKSFLSDRIAAAKIQAEIKKSNKRDEKCGN